VAPKTRYVRPDAFPALISGRRFAAHSVFPHAAKSLSICLAPYAPGCAALLLAAFLPGAIGAPIRGQAQQEYSLAAPILTLDEAIALALKGNYGVVNATLGVTKSGATVSAIKTHRLPALNLDGAARRRRSGPAPAERSRVLSQDQPQTERSFIGARVSDRSTLRREGPQHQT